MYMCINYINEMYKRMNFDLYTILENVNILICFFRELGKINIDKLLSLVEKLYVSEVC